MNDSPDAERLSEALLRGQKAAEELGAATDQLTEALLQIERALAEQRLGVSASVRLQTTHGFDENSGDEEVDLDDLSFRKEGKRWSLFIDSGPEHPCGPGDWHSIPLANASRELRLLAVEKLPELIDALVRNAESQLAEIHAGRAKALGVLETLKATRRSKEKKP